MSTERIESQILSGLLRDLEADGYEIYLQPKPRLLPEFLRSYTPDAIALRQDSKLAIEVIRPSKQSETKLKRIRNLFKDQSDWRLKVVLATPASAIAEKPQVQGVPAIEKRAKEVSELAAGGHFGAGMVLAWATLEALARALLSDRFERPQTPRRIVQVLAEEGYITPTEADGLRLLAEKRNRFVHGGLQTRITRAELDRFAGILNGLLETLKQ